MAVLVTGGGGYIVGACVPTLRADADGDRPGVYGSLPTGSQRTLLGPLVAPEPGEAA